MNNVNKQLYILSLFIITTVFLLYKRSFVDDVPSCDNYITNVYLYILLGILILNFTVIFISKRNFAITNNKSLIFFIIAIFLIFLLHSTDPKDVFLNHFIWLLFILSLSINFYTILRYGKHKDTIVNTSIIVLVLFTCLTLIAHIKPEWVNLNLGSTLLIALFTGILVQLIPLFSGKPLNKFYKKILSGMFVFIFIMLILYDTKILRIKAASCTFPNYPKDSISLFLDVINLFVNLK